MPDISVVIVAVPSNADDLPGPESKHCTLQYLGKVGDTAAPTLGDSLPALLNAVSAAAASIQPFTLPVERVGTLGDEGATVWFLEDQDMRMAELRAQALTPTVQALMEAGSFTKHPEFTPHVTVGYNVEASPEVKAVESIPFYAVALWWGDQHIEFPLGSLASPMSLEALQSLAIVDVHGNWHHPHTGKFIRKPWEFDQTLKAMFPEDVTLLVDKLNDAPKGTTWEDVYRLRKNLRVLAKEPENEALIDAAWAKVADLRERFSLAAVKNMSEGSGRGKPLEGLPDVDTWHATMDLVEEGLEFLETAWLYDNYGRDENPDQEMLPLGPISFEPIPNEMPIQYAVEKTLAAGRESFASIFDTVHRIRRSADIFANEGGGGAPKSGSAKKKAKAEAAKPKHTGPDKASIDGGKLSKVVNALTKLGDTPGVRSVKGLAKKGSKAGLNDFVDGKIKTLEQTAKSLEAFLSTEPSDYNNPYDNVNKDGSPAKDRSEAAKKGAESRTPEERAASAQKAAETRAKNGKEQKRAEAGAAGGIGGQFIDDPDVAAKNAGGLTSAKGIKAALTAGDIPKAQKIAEQYLTKVNSTLDQLYTITFAAMGVVLASGATREAIMKETLLAKWEGPLGFEGQFTGDNRMIAPGALTWADDSFPQPMRWAAEDIGAHDGARVIGTIEGMSRLDEPMEWSGKTLPAGTIFGWGTFDLDSELGAEAQRQVVKKLSNGVSLDLDKVSAEMLDADAAATELGLALDDAIEDRAVTLIRGARNRAATLVALPAFEGARIEAVVQWSHDGGQTLKADRFKATMTALATEGVAAFAGIRVDAGGRWGVTLPRKGYRWVDMPDVAIDNLIDTIKKDRDFAESQGEELEVSLEDQLGPLPEIKTDVDAAFANPTVESILKAQNRVQEALDGFPFEDYFEDDPGWDGKGGVPGLEHSGEQIRDALEGFVAQSPDDVVNVLEDRAEGKSGEVEESASEAPAASDGPKSGRGPSGKPRNFQAMKDDKFIAEAAKIRAEGNDDEVLEIIDAEERRRGLSTPSANGANAEEVDPATVQGTPEQQERFLEDIRNSSGSKGKALNPFMTQDDAMLQRNLELTQEADAAILQEIKKKGASPERTRERTRIQKELAAIKAEIERRKSEGAGGDLPEGVTELSDEDLRAEQGASLEDMGAQRAVRIDENLLGGEVMDGRDTILQGEDGKWYYPGSSNIQYDSVEDYIEQNKDLGADDEVDEPPFERTNSNGTPQGVAKDLAGLKAEAERIRDGSSLEQREDYGFFVQGLERVAELPPELQPLGFQMLMEEEGVGAGRTPDFMMYQERIEKANTAEPTKEGIEQAARTMGYPVEPWLEGQLGDGDGDGKTNEVEKGTTEAEAAPAREDASTAMPQSLMDEEAEDAQFEAAAEVAKGIWENGSNDDVWDAVMDYPRYAADKDIQEDVGDSVNVAAELLQRIEQDPSFTVGDMEHDDVVRAIRKKFPILGEGPFAGSTVQLRENWVEQTGGLPTYIREIADALIKKGFDESRAIATAVNTVKRWARGGEVTKTGSDHNVSAGTVAKAAAALAEWEAKKAAAKATAVQADLMSKFGTVGSESILSDVPAGVIDGIVAREQVVRGVRKQPARTPQQVEESKESAARRARPVTPDKTTSVVASGGRRWPVSVARGPKLPETRSQREAHGQPAAEYDRSLVASGARALAAPVKPPSSWFQDPKFRGASPLTVTKDGRVFGHLALWGSCHTGFDGQCLTVPRSASDYSLFHLGVVECEDGTEVAVGRLAMNTGHANDTFGSRKAIAHYENTGLAIADLRAGEDQFGIWVAGALRPDATPEQIRALKASPLSGDWRHNPATNSLDLVMALAVNQPGFAVPRPKFLVASGAVRTLTAAGMLAPAKVSKIKVQQALAGDEAAAADIRYLQKLAADARRAEAKQLRAKVLESTGARRKIQEMAASLALKPEES